jgi:DNA polymerase IV
MFVIIEGEHIFGDGVMNTKKDNIIFHIDVNSAYLSWTAVKFLQYGGK